jgi:hypothetical protein
MRPFCIVLFLSCICLHASEVDDAVSAAKKAASFLIAQQNDDGTFGKGRESAMPGVVGLTVQSLVHSPEKWTEENSPAVKKGVAYMLSKQQDNGSFALPKFGLENYNTAFAVMAIAPLHNPAYSERLKKAKDYLMTCQFLGKREEAGFGSFGYSPGSSGDLSNTAYALDALTILSVPTTDDVWKNALIFVRRCQDTPETNDLPGMKAGPGSGGFVYRPQSSPVVETNGKHEKFVPKAYGSMSFEGFRLLASSTTDATNDPALQAAKKWIANNFTVSIHPGVAATNEKFDDKAGYFYYIYGLSKALSERGEKELTLAGGKKVLWASELAKQLISIQGADGSFTNSNGAWMENSKILATAYALSAFNECIKEMQKQ